MMCIVYACLHAGAKRCAVVAVAVFLKCKSNYKATNTIETIYNNKIHAHTHRSLCRRQWSVRLSGAKTASKTELHLLFFLLRIIYYKNKVSVWQLVDFPYIIVRFTVMFFLPFCCFASILSFSLVSISINRKNHFCSLISRPMKYCSMSF